MLWALAKAMMEKTFVAKSRSIEDTVICGTRYGNVMASRGSVIPLFVDQIKNNMPLTITDPNMTRYLMSLVDAVDLVLYAFENGRSGDIFVQKAPASTIADLAKALLELYQSSSEIKIIGTRHGEKLYETLLTREEMIHAEDLGEYYRIPADQRDLNYDKYFTDGQAEVDYGMELTSHNTTRLDIEGVKALLLTLPTISKDVNQ